IVASTLTFHPIIQSIHTHVERLSFLDRLVMKLLFRLRHVRAVIVPSAGLQRSISRYARTDKVFVIPNPVDIAALQGSNAIPDTPTVQSIVAMGRLVPIKRFDALIRAYAASSLKDAADLIILGEGPERAALEQLISDLGLARVRLVGQ